MKGLFYGNKGQLETVEIEPGNGKWKWSNCHLVVT